MVQFKILVMTLVTLVFLRADTAAQMTVNPDTFGAMGNGFDWDHAALQAAIDAAGIGGTIQLTHGKTYVLCSRLRLRQGQTLVGNGATVKRCDSILTWLTSAAAVNASAIEVEHPENFEVGQRISIFTGPTHDEGESKTNPQITAINGSTLSLNQGIANAYPVGAGVIMVDLMFYVPDDDVTISGVILDGNRRNNNEWIAWERGSTILMPGHMVVINRNLFKDCWSNCLTASGIADVTENVFDSVGAAVVHLSTVDSLLFEHNQMIDTNTQAAQAEHSEAALTWSASNKNVTIRDNCLYNAGAGAIGRINRRNNRDVTIEENSFCETDGFFLMRLHQTPNPGFEEYGRMVVRNNVAVNVGGSTIVHGGGSLPPIGNVGFFDNQIVNGYLDFAGLDSALFFGNTFYMLDEATYGPQDVNYEDRAGLLTLRKPLHTVVEANTLVGGEKGMYLMGDDGLAPDSLIIRGNVVLDSERAGIATSKINWLTGNSDYRSDNSGILLDSNVIKTMLLTDSGDAGLLTTRGITAEDNCVETNEIGAEVTGTNASLATGSQTTFYITNTLLGDNGGVNFRNSSYVSDILFDTNTWSSAIPSEYSSATGTVLQGNVVDAGASCTAPSPSPAPTCQMCDGGMPELDGVFLDLTLLLEGSYAGGGMMATGPNFQTALADTGWIQPYGASKFDGTPLEHHGTEFIQPTLPAAMVDWVVVALRSSTAANTEVARIAGILMTDGSVRSLDASPEVFFPAVAKSAFYVVVYHRNHLAVMSSSPVNFTSGHGTWDFTSAAGQAFSSGGAAMKHLGSGVYGLFGGDLTADGMVTATDFNDWLTATKLAATGYLVEDLNFDAQVTTSDYNVWLTNTKLAATTQVP